MFDYCLKFQIHVVERSKPMTTFATCIIFYLISFYHTYDKDYIPIRGNCKNTTTRFRKSPPQKNV